MVTFGSQHVSHVIRCLLRVNFAGDTEDTSAFLQFFGESTLHTSFFSRAKSKITRVKAQIVSQSGPAFGWGERGPCPGR
jgi:hypothetical protein